MTHDLMRMFYYFAAFTCQGREQNEEKEKIQRGNRQK